MGALALVGASSTPRNAAKDGRHVQLRVRDVTTGGIAAPASPEISPFQGQGTPLVITNAQLQTACPRGDLRRLFRARDTAVPPLAGGALTQAQARALLLSQDSSPGTPTVLNTGRVPRAVCTIHGTHFIGTAGAVRPNLRNWTLDASVDVSGRPTLIVRCTWTSRAVATATAVGAPWDSPSDALINIVFQHSLDGR